MQKTALKHEKLAVYVQMLLERGERSFTKRAALKELRLQEVPFLQSALRLIKKQVLIKPVSGFYVIVTPEFRAAGGPPPIWYIDDLMKFLGQPYYVGVLSAASLHGASHQAVMELQIVTTKPLKPIVIGKNRIKFFVNKYTQKIPTEERKTPNGKVIISTAGATAVDLVRFQKHSGGFSHIATVLSEMGKKVETGDLVRIAEIYRDAPLIQRVGFLLEKFVPGIRLKTLHGWLKFNRPEYKTISGKRSGERVETNKKWLVIQDIELEPDDV